MGKWTGRVRWRRWVVGFLFLGGIAFNAVAWMQAWNLTHYTEGGTRTRPPEQLAPLERYWTMLSGVQIPRPANVLNVQQAGYVTRRIPLPAGESLEVWEGTNPRAQRLVVMFPGYATSKASLQPVASIFRARGYSVVLADYRGVGGSSGNDTTLGVREGADVAAVVAAMRQEYPQHMILLYGESLGAAAILRAVAHEGVQPDGIMLQSPFDSLVDTVGNRFESMGLPAFPAAQTLVLWGSVQHGMNGFTDNPADDAAAVHCPALVLHGDHDPRVTVAQNERIYAALAGPKTLVRFPTGGHDALRLVDPALWDAQVSRFLSSLAGAQ